MATAIYIVIFSRDAWWVDLNGKSQGPFQTLDLAKEEAVANAVAASRRGDRSEVRISGPGHENDLIYQSAERSVLGRAIASTSMKSAS